MQQVSHQTVKLRKGRHSSPSEGVCVMELASMLAGETFNDHPRSVSRSIASFLRSYNDILDQKRRQDLYAFAAKSVGTAGPPSVEAFRAARLIAWGDELLHRRVFGRLRRRIAGRRFMDPDEAGQYAVRAIRKLSDETHTSALALVDELILMGPGTVVWDPAGASPSGRPDPRQIESGGVR